MDELEVAPVPLRLVQRARLTPGHASFRTHPKTLQTVLPSVDYDLVAVLLPPESSPSSFPTTPRTPSPPDDARDASTSIGALPVLSRGRIRAPRAAPPWSSRRRLAAGESAPNPPWLTTKPTHCEAYRWVQGPPNHPVKLIPTGLNPVTLTGLAHLSVVLKKRFK